VICRRLFNETEQMNPDNKASAGPYILSVCVFPEYTCEYTCVTADKLPIKTQKEKVLCLRCLNFRGNPAVDV